MFLYLYQKICSGVSSECSYKVISENGRIVRSLQTKRNFKEKLLVRDTT